VFSLVNTMLAGLIIAVVVAGGLVYVFSSLKRSGEAEALGIDSPDAIGGEMVVVRPGNDDADDVPDAQLQVSTPLLREAARHDIARSARAATRYRRISLAGAGVLTLGVVAAVVFAPISTLFALATPVPLIAWVLLARRSVSAGRRRRADRLTALDQGWDEQTQLIKVEAAPPAVANQSTRGEMSVELSVPLKNMTSLLEPLPVTPSTYVSKPLMPRSVRTIDLSAPRAKNEPAFPVSADYPQDALPFDMGVVDRSDDSDELPFAVGE